MGAGIWQRQRFGADHNPVLHRRNLRGSSRNIRKHYLLQYRPVNNSEEVDPGTSPAEEGEGPPLFTSGRCTYRKPDYSALPSDPATSLSQSFPDSIFSCSWWNKTSRLSVISADRHPWCTQGAHNE